MKAMSLDQCQQGMVVQLICAHPEGGWGYARRFDIGYISRVNHEGESLSVNFANQDGWWGRPEEFELVRAPYELEIGMRVKSMREHPSLPIGEVGTLIRFKKVEQYGELVDYAILRTSEDKTVEARARWIYPAYSTNKDSKNTLSKLGD